MQFPRQTVFLSCLAFSVLAAGPALAMTMKECSAKYQSAKDAGSLNGMKWNDFRKSQCGTDATDDAQPAATTSAKKKNAAAAASDNSDDDQAGLTSKQCSAKYQAAKAADALNGMKWNDFRKAECGPGASATFTPAKASKSTAAASDSSAGAGLSMKECSAKYQDAKASNALNGMKWNDFRKARCGASASDDDSVPSMDEASYDSEPAAPVAKAPRGVTFPKTVSSKFSDETPAKARMHSCLEGYYANKDANSLNGLRWIQKGGGYYSLCNARLKGNS